MDTPVAVTEMLLRIEEMYAPKPAPLGNDDHNPTIS